MMSGTKADLTKKLTYEEAVHKIKEIQDILKTHKDDPAALPSTFSYFDTLKQLRYLRNKISKLKHKK